MDILIRNATPEDAEAVADVYLASRKQFLPYAPLVHTDDEVRQWIARVVIPDQILTVAVAEAGVVGMIATRCEDGIGWIEHLYLHPSAVGQGIGARLLAQAIEELGSPIRLYTFQANESARRFYERHGFQAIAFGDGSDNEEKCPDVLYERR